MPLQCQCSSTFYFVNAEFLTPAEVVVYVPGFLRWIWKAQSPGLLLCKRIVVLPLSAFVQVDLKIKGDSLLLDVDGEEVLRLSQISGPLHNKSQHIMRLAIGGLLFPLSILRLPVNTSPGTGSWPKLGKAALG